MHANAPLTSRGRLILVERIASGRPVAHVAAEMGISRKTADKWWKRWLAEGETGLEDRSSRPRRCPHQTPARLERRIIALRRRRKLGPARIASIVGLPTSTVHRVLSRHGLNRLAWMDRPSGQVIRRMHTDRPGELVHIDVKKLGRIPPGGVGEPMAGNVAHTPRPGWDSTSSTPPSTPTPAWPSQRSSPTRRSDLRSSSSGPGLLRCPRDPHRGRPHRQRQELPGNDFAQLWHHRTPKDPTTPARRTERSSASTAPSLTSGLRPDLHLKAQRTRALTAGSTATTITGSHGHRRPATSMTTSRTTS